MTPKAPRFAPITFEDALAMRQTTGLNQSKFWSRIGVGQSSSSRYETGRRIQKPIQILLRIAYGAKTQADKQLIALRPSIVPIKETTS